MTRRTAAVRPQREALRVTPVLALVAALLLPQAVGALGALATFGAVRDWYPTLVQPSFAPLSRAAAVLMLPYGAWVAFASVLNAGFWWLNRSSG